MIGMYTLRAYPRVGIEYLYGAPYRLLVDLLKCSSGR